MRKFNKIISCVIALTMLLSMFSMISVSAASLDGLTLTYTPAEGTAKGVADGTVTISGITEDLQSAITNINICWGKNSTDPLDNYYNLKYYTVNGYYNEDGTADGVAANGKLSKLVYTNDSLVYTLKGNMAIPNGATHIIAKVVTDSEEKWVSVEIPESKKLNLTSDSLKYAMIWGSDIHFDKSSVLSGTVSRKAMDGANVLADLYGDKFKGMILNGDIANSAKNYEYAIAEQVMEEHGVDYPVYYTTGNHDTIMFSNGVSKYDESDKAMAYRFDKLEEDFGLTFEIDDTWSYDTTIGGHHYIFFESPVGASGGVGMTDARKAWIEEKISMYEKSGEPTFVFSHYPYGTKITSKDYGLSFDEILTRHPSVTVITSHVHKELNSDSTNTLMNDPVSGNNFMDTSSMSYTNTPNGAERKDIAETRVVEVYDDVIIVKGRDLNTNTWIPRAEYVLNVNGSDAPFVGEFDIESTSAEGTMEVGTVLTAKLNGSAIPAGYTVNWYNMSGVELATQTDTYTVETANASVSAKIVNDADNSYARAVARYIAPVEDDGEGDSGDGETTLPSDSLTYDGPTSIKYFGDVVYLTGTVDATYAGKEATMVLISKADYPDMSKAKYFGYCTITETGAYTFKFKASSVKAGDIFLIKAGDDIVRANEISEKGANEEIVELTEVDVNDDGKVTFKLQNKYADTTNAKIIVATYDGSDKLIKATPVSYDIAFGENGEIVNYLAETATDLTGSAYVRIFMWTSMTDIRPLSNDNTVITGSVETIE